MHKDRANGRRRQEHLDELLGEIVLSKTGGVRAKACGHPADCGSGGNLLAGRMDTTKVEIDRATEKVIDVIESTLRRVARVLPRKAQVYIASNTLVLSL
jgi:hypothetical protein